MVRTFAQTLGVRSENRKIKDEDNAAREAAFDANIAIIESRILALLEQPFESLADDQLASLLNNIAEKY